MLIIRRTEVRRIFQNRLKFQSFILFVSSSFHNWPSAAPGIICSSRTLVKVIKDLRFRWRSSDIRLAKYFNGNCSKKDNVISGDVFHPGIHAQKSSGLKSNVELLSNKSI
ncbi:hypothetical protein AVEN_210602-1 [Araneus ventricosus]|uniref:Uncharacterized protein n=1 Tax=Araneus ventricosus TaxID=182803 RepID=A0A4Y2MWJ4_ARAVE|nr:hypothetical protein AVEN_210602-1 [Araneus ventricosus]